MRKSNCRECGKEFVQPHQRGKPFWYCEEHRGPENTRRREYVRDGRQFGVGAGFFHTCTERCAAVKEMIERKPPPTLQEIGDHFGFTRARAQQIISRHGWKKPSVYNGHMCPTCDTKIPTGMSLEEHRKTNLAHERAIVEHRRAHGVRMTNWDLCALVYALHMAGYGPGEISWLTDSAPGVPYRYLNRLGLNPYVRGPNIRLGVKEAAERDVQIAMAYAEGVSTATIMEMFDVKRGNLVRIVKEEGVKRPQWMRDEHMDYMRKIRNAKRRAANV